MNSIGIIGGIGYKATSYFYNRINTLYELKMGKGNSCPILLVSLNFKEINALLPYGIDEVAEIIKPSIQYLDEQETICNILINNTMHKALDIVLANNTLKIPYCHIGELLNEKLVEIEDSTVVILGTAFTMKDDYLKSFVPDKHRIVIPSDEIIQEVDELRQLHFNSTDEIKAKKCYEKLESNYPENTIFIIACTELSIAFSTLKNNKNWLDTIDLQCESALNKLINKK